MYEKFNTMEEYRTTLVNLAKYPLIMFAMAKIMEMTKEEQKYLRPIESIEKVV